MKNNRAKRLKHAENQQKYAETCKTNLRKYQDLIARIERTPCNISRPNVKAAQIRACLLNMQELERNIRPAEDTVPPVAEVVVPTDASQGRANGLHRTLIQTPHAQNAYCQGVK